MIHTLQVEKLQEPQSIIVGWGLIQLMIELVQIHTAGSKFYYF